MARGNDSRGSAGGAPSSERPPRIFSVEEKIAGEGFTFDDVLLLPGPSEILPHEVDTRGRFSRSVTVGIPIASAAMDTVTESAMAIALAREGGIGVIHKNLSVEDQVREVVRVKRSANGVIRNPVTVTPEATTEEAWKIMQEQQISGLPVVEPESGVVVGILTHRDLRFHKGPKRPVSDVMTKALVTAPPDTTLEEAREILHTRKVEKLLLVDEKRRLVGLITIKDIQGLVDYPLAARDEFGRLRVAAAVGVSDDERARRLVEAGVDVLVVDTAHGHSRAVVEAVRRYKELDVDVVAGNVATEQAARDLVEAGADGVKVGIGPGSICTTRVVAGVGVPQLSAILAVQRVTRAAGVPLVADGGIRHSGDIAKALASGADCVMIGGLFAGVEESPGEVVLHRGRTYKQVRGMGSLGAMAAGGAERYRQDQTASGGKFVPEGVEGIVPYKGKLSDFVFQLVGGLKAGMGYVGARNLEELYLRGRFVRVTVASLRESHPHDLEITKEAPNYSTEW